MSRVGGADTPAEAGTPSFASLLADTSPSTGLEELMSGAVDGLAVANLVSASDLPREICENYCGNGDTSGSVEGFDTPLGAEARSYDCLGNWTVTAIMVNKQGTMAPDLWPMCEQMFRAATEYDLALAAEHILGVENTLLDHLCCYVRGGDSLAIPAG
ncbi:hypothetical protein CYMTET_22861 [Cymbomonas tetramitiformis]|uniref:Uncharacterized protein n=1 Tax=Cymbomonas tetramitiformis TaxID=36881 RepID=A0AAE0FZD7_9CHLO|nr:hypothetical protein CYMTET_22861 [Cymbomonas tetramitiformis]